MVYNNILETIGNTPLIKLHKITAEIPCPVYAKVEAFNPGHSAKDRIAVYMINKAEQEGKLHPGDILVEASSGNTGYGLAMVARLKGYGCVITVTDKTSIEKINLLKAMGAEVVVCPSSVDAGHPESKYSKAITLSNEIENAYYVDQNYNLDNSDTHYYSTGPEIWKATEGKVTHIVACAGTGGTISGIARYLKEQNPDIKVWAVDAYGSVLKKFHETGEFDPNEISSYRVEGLGKKIIPDNVNFDLIDHFEKVTDEDSAYAARQLAMDEGILAGYSSGSVIQAIYQLRHQLSPNDLVVGMLNDHGSRYLGKVFNDEWMKEQGFETQLKRTLDYSPLFK